MSTVEGGGNIVTNQLAFYSDIANPKSYISGSTTWNDLSSGGNNLTLVNGPTFNSNNNGSIVFDGIDDRVSLTSSINTGQNFTVSAWIFPTILGGTRRTVVANSMNYSSRNGWLFSVAGGGGTNGFFISIGADQAYRISANNLLTLNQWAFISAVCVNGGTNLLLYLNGVEVPSYLATLLSSGTITYTHPQFHLGFRNVGGVDSDPYTGRIAQTAIYTRVLSAEEILQHYNATRSRYQL